MHNEQQDAKASGASQRTAKVLDKLQTVAQKGGREFKALLDYQEHYLHAFKGAVAILWLYGMMAGGITAFFLAVQHLLPNMGVRIELVWVPRFMEVILQGMRDVAIVTYSVVVVTASALFVGMLFSSTGVFMVQYIKNWQRINEGDDDYGGVILESSTPRSLHTQKFVRDLSQRPQSRGRLIQLQEAATEALVPKEPSEILRQIEDAKANLDRETLMMLVTRLATDYEFECTNCKSIYMHFVTYSDASGFTGDCNTCGDDSPVAPVRVCVHDSRDIINSDSTEVLHYHAKSDGAMVGCAGELGFVPRPESGRRRKSFKP